MRVGQKTCQSIWPHTGNLLDTQIASSNYSLLNCSHFRSQLLKLFLADSTKPRHRTWLLSACCTVCSQTSVERMCIQSRFIAIHCYHLLLTVVFACLRANRWNLIWAYTHSIPITRRGRMRATRDRCGKRKSRVFIRVLCFFIIPLIVSIN